MTFGTPATGGSLYLNTPSLNSSYQSGLGIDGTYGTPSKQSVINIRALGVKSGNGYGSQLAFWTTNGATPPNQQQMTIDMNGNVGIGTTSPSLKLQVVNGAMGAGIVAPIPGTSWSIDLSTGNTQQFACGTAGATVTVSLVTTSFVKGETVTLIFVQNSSTACTLSWPAHIYGQMTTGQVSTLGSVNVQQFVVSNNQTDLYAASAVQSNTGGTP